jgi:hypothetical protein
MESERLLLYSQESATVPYPEPNERAVNLIVVQLTSYGTRHFHHRHFERSPFSPSHIPHQFETDLKISDNMSGLCFTSTHLELDRKTSSLDSDFVVLRSLHIRMPGQYLK